MSILIAPIFGRGHAARRAPCVIAWNASEVNRLSSARALVLESPRQLISRELALPAIGADDGLLRVEACGLCGTDHEEFTGDLFPGYPFVPGHESIGVVEQVGPNAAARWGVHAGDR